MAEQTAIRPLAVFDKGAERLFFNNMRVVARVGMASQQATGRAGGGGNNARRNLQLDIIVPVVMGCALLWWVGREMNLIVRLAVGAVTLALILVVLMFEQSR